MIVVDGRIMPWRADPRRRPDVSGRQRDGPTRRRGRSPRDPTGGADDRQSPSYPPTTSEDRGHRVARRGECGVRTVQPDDPIVASPHLATRPGTPRRRGVPGLSFVYRVRQGSPAARYSFRATPHRAADETDGRTPVI